MDAILDDPVRGPMVSAIDFHAWVYRPDGRLFAARGDLNRSPREQRPDIATAEELEALTRRLGRARLDQADFLNGPEYQALFDTLWASSTPMKYAPGANAAIAILISSFSAPTTRIPT